jgi:phage tail sheath protein FI
MSRRNTSHRDFSEHYEGYAPGVYLEDWFNLPRRESFSTGVPAILGVMPIMHPPRNPVRLSLWSQFKYHVSEQIPDCNLAHAVYGFFQNGGRECYVVVLKSETIKSLQDGLDAISKLNTVDLVCAPDLVNDHDQAFEKQQILMNHCEQMGDRFAILDSRRGDDPESASKQWSAIDGYSGAIYYPWIKVQGFHGGPVLVSPCGHIAGVYSRTDASRGVHKAPANETLEGVLDLEHPLKHSELAFLNSERVNCLRAWPGRGILVWGARTLSGHDAWMYVNVRRVFLTAIRWIQWHMVDVVFEPNNQTLWSRIEQELTAYFYQLYRAGALKGQSHEEAFYVKCNAETNSLESLDLGEVVTEIGLAPANPFEFVIVRLIHGARGVRVLDPIRAV